jgi:hypothetical protein
MGATSDHIENAGREIPFAIPGMYGLDPVFPFQNGGDDETKRLFERPVRLIDFDGIAVYGGGDDDGSCATFGEK